MVSPDQNSMNHSSAQEVPKERKLEFPFQLCIPGSVAALPNLCATAKLHFGCLTALSNKEGYCWATDPQLAEMHGVDKSQIFRWHEALKEHGLIYCETEQKSYKDADGNYRWKKRRRIYILPAFSKKYTDNCKNAASANSLDSKNVSDDCKNAAIDDDCKNAAIDDDCKNAAIKKRSSKEEKDKGVNACAQARPGTSGPPPAFAGGSPPSSSSLSFSRYLKKHYPQMVHPSMQASEAQVKFAIGRLAISDAQLTATIDWLESNDWWPGSISSWDALIRNWEKIQTAMHQEAARQGAQAEKEMIKTDPLASEKKRAEENAQIIREAAKEHPMLLPYISFNIANRMMEIANGKRFEFVDLAIPFVHLEREVNAKLKFVGLSYQLKLQ